MIKIRQYQRKWRIEIELEELEFETLEEMNSILQSILAYKNKYGDIKK